MADTKAKKKPAAKKPAAKADDDKRVVELQKRLEMSGLQNDDLKDKLKKLEALAEQRGAELEKALARIKELEDADSGDNAHASEFPAADRPVLANPAIHAIAELRRRTEIRGSVGPADLKRVWADLALPPWQQVREELGAAV